MVKTGCLQSYQWYEFEKIVGPEYVVTDQSEKDVQSIDVWWMTRYCFFQQSNENYPH